MTCKRAARLHRHTVVANILMLGDTLASFGSLMYSISQRP